MRFHFTILFLLLLPLLASASPWENRGVKVLGTGASNEKKSTMYRMTDDNGNTFEVNYREMPDEETQKRVIALKDTFYGWKEISSERTEFFFSDEGIYSILHIRTITYRGKNLAPFLPAGLAFQDRKEGLYYRFRIIVENTSYMLEGIYTGEEDLLERIYTFVEKEKMKASGYDTSPEVKTESTEENKKHRLSACIYGNCLLPTRKLASLFAYGYGGMAGITLHDTGISISDKTLFHLDFTLAAGYWRYRVKDDAGDVTTCRIDSAYIIPMSLTARYRFALPHDFFVAPVVSVGYNYNSIDYFEHVSGADDRAVKIREWAPSLGGGVQTGYHLIRDKLTIIAGVQYTSMFERYMTTHSFVFQAGMEYSFTSFGN